MGSNNAYPKEITVDPSGSVPTLSAALQQAADGDRIIVKPGVYREGPILIDKRVEISGQNYPEFDGEDKYQVITVKADSVIIRGIAVSRSGVSFVEDNAAIKVDGANNCIIENNKLIDNFFGIYLSKSGGSRVANNRIHSSRKGSEATAGNGIHLWYCKDVLIENNSVSGHRDGVYFEFVEDGLIRNNHSEGNLRYGLHFMFSDRCKYRDNTFLKNSAGVAVMYTRNVEMSGNRFEQSWGGASYGLLLKEISDSKIDGNTFLKNSIGIYAENSNRITVEKNDFLENGWAVKIMANCTGNYFTQNNFIGNSLDVATNSRNNFSRFENNYWSGYQGYDLNRDGYGDVPFRPVRLFSLIVQQNPPALMLLRSLFIDVLDLAENIFPVLTPETLMDSQPMMRRIP